MPKNLVATATTTISAPRSKVWKALTTPADVKKFMFGTDMTADWRKGGAITFRGEWQGRPYADKGEVLDFEPERLLRYTHFSPLAGLPDKPENYHTVTIELSDAGSGTQVKLSQENNTSEEDRKHSEQNWNGMLSALQKHLA